MQAKRIWQCPGYAPTRPNVNRVLVAPPKRTWLMLIATPQGCTALIMHLRAINPDVQRHAVIYLQGFTPPEMPPTKTKPQNLNRNPRTPQARASAARLMLSVTPSSKHSRRSRVQPRYASPCSAVSCRYAADSWPLTALRAASNRANRSRSRRSLSASSLRPRRQGSGISEISGFRAPGVASF